MSTKHLLPILIALLLNLFASPLAFGSESCTNFNRGTGWRAEVEIGMYECGESDQYESGATTVAQAMPTAVSNWQQCVRVFGEPQCRVFGKGFTSGPRAPGRCDYDQGHDYKNHALGDSRAELSMAAFLDAVPEAWDNTLKNDVCWDTAVRKSYVVVRAVDGAIPLAEMAKPACSDGKDNDGDGLIDRDDPGCSDAAGAYHADDGDEYNVPDPDQKWGFLTQVLLRETDNLCPTYIIADSRGQTYSISNNRCGCSNFDANPKSVPFEVTSDIGIARRMVADHTEWESETKDTSYTMVREYLQEGTWANVTELDNTNAVSTLTPDDGLSVSFLENVDTLRVQFPDRCEDAVASQHREDYEGLNWLIMGNGTLQGSVLGDGSSLSTHPWGSVAGEFGFTAGSSRGAFMFTAGLGGTFDDNCGLPSAFMVQGRIGSLLNPGGRGGLVVDFRPQYSFGPSYSITPDDPETADINEYAANPTLGSNSFAGLVDIGGFVTFGPGGMKNGFVMFALTGGPKLRWLPDAADQNLRHPTLTGDVGGSVAVGWMF